MIRRHENPLALKAAALSLLVHVLFFLLLFVSFNWKSAQPMQVAEVELWDALPAPPVVARPEPKPEPPKPVIRPKPEPPPPPPEPKAEIAVERPKPKPPAPPRVEQPRPDPRQQAAEEDRKRREEQERLQRQLAAQERELLEERQRREAQQLAQTRAAQSAAQAQGAIHEYLGQIAGKIRQYVNPHVCGENRPTLVFRIALMPTGELLAPPRLEKGSDIAACDAAVERAILQAQPLPLPSDPDLIARLRDLRLEFRPNE